MLDLGKYPLAARVLSLKMTGQIGPRTFQTLLAHFTNVDNILLADLEELQEIEGIGPARARAIFEAEKHIEEAARQIELLEASNTRVVSCLDVDYPNTLSGLNDPPMLLYYRGKLPQQDEKRVAIIGSQDVSNDGIANAVELAKRLADNKISIMGGLAQGIDSAGHTGALKAGGITYAVLPSGFNQIFPPENSGLSEEIAASGGLLSEYLPDTPVNAGRLLNRNRLIVGLSQAIIVGEVSEGSVGTLDTALCCQQLGKLLFVIIGKNNPHYERLAGYGAIPLTSIDEYEMIIKAIV